MKQPLFNNIVFHVSEIVKKYVIDMPKLSSEQKEEIAKLAGIFVANTIKEKMKK
jgi:hypothetical protein